MAGLTESIRNAEQISRMDDYLGRQCKRNQMLWRVGCNTGLRISDIRILTAGDVRGTHLVMRMTKTKKLIRVPINPTLKKWLQSYIANLEDGDFLFSSREGWNKPLTRSRCYQIVRQAAEACGIPRVGTHTMRKTFGYWFYKEKGDVAALMELFGHSDPSVTLRYIGIIQADIDGLMKSFSVGG